MADVNNQDAPVTTENAEQTNDSPNAAGTETAGESTTQNPAESAAPAFDPRTSYDSLVKELQNVNKSYGSLRSEFTRRTQYEAQLKQEVESLRKIFAEATKQEISPEEFKKSLETQGIKAFDPLRQEWTKELKDGYEKELSSRDQAFAALQTDFEVMRRELDVTNYPDFAKLKETMNEIAGQENCPVDFNQPVGVIYDTLYKLARNLKAEDSIKQAREIGRKESDAQAAKEASTAVAAGGKTNTSGIDPRNMSADALKKHFTKLGMVSD